MTLPTTKVPGPSPANMQRSPAASANELATDVAAFDLGPTKIDGEPVISLPLVALGPDSLDRLSPGARTDAPAGPDAAACVAICRDLDRTFREGHDVQFGHLGNFAARVRRALRGAA